MLTSIRNKNSKHNNKFDITDANKNDVGAEIKS